MHLFAILVMILLFLWSIKKDIKNEQRLSDWLYEQENKHH